MRNPDEIGEKMREMALVAARSNDARYGSPTDYLVAHGGVMALAWALGMTEEETKDTLAWGVVTTYRESPGILSDYFGGPVPDRFKVDL